MNSGYRHAYPATLVLFLGLVLAHQLSVQAKPLASQTEIKPTEAKPDSLKKGTSGSRSFGYGAAPVQNYATNLYQQPTSHLFPTYYRPTNNYGSPSYPVQQQQVIVANRPPFATQLAPVPQPAISWSRQDGFATPVYDSAPIRKPKFSRLPKVAEIFLLSKPEISVTKDRPLDDRFGQNDQKTTFTFTKATKTFGPLEDQVFQPHFYVEEVSVQKPHVDSFEDVEHPLSDSTNPIENKVQDTIGTVLSKTPDVTTLNVGADDLKPSNLLPNIVGSAIDLGKTVDQVVNSSSLAGALDAVTTNLGNISPVGDISTSGGDSNSISDAPSAGDNLIKSGLVDSALNKVVDTGGLSKTISNVSNSQDDVGAATSAISGTLDTSDGPDVPKESSTSDDSDKSDRLPSGAGDLVPTVTSKLGARKVAHPLSNFVSDTVNNIGKMTDVMVPGSKDLMNQLIVPTADSLISSITGAMPDIGGNADIGKQSNLGGVAKSKSDQEAVAKAEVGEPPVKTAGDSAALLNKFLTGKEEEIPGIPNLEKLTKVSESISAQVLAPATDLQSGTQVTVTSDVPPVGNSTEKEENEAPSNADNTTADKSGSTIDQSIE